VGVGVVAVAGKVVDDAGGAELEAIGADFCEAGG
jgi:hypothetical protein